MPRVVSFIVLLGILLLIGSLFFQVMVQFVLPLFLAAVLVVIFKPLHEWVCSKLPERPRIAALVTTFLIVSAVVLPTVGLGWRAYLEVRGPVVSFLNDEEARSELTEAFSERENRLLKLYEDTFGSKLDLGGLMEDASKLVSGWLLSGVKAVFGLLVGMAIMSFALYYFLADGPGMVKALMQLSPLDDQYERELLDKFSNVSRSVVGAVLLSAIAQGFLAGIGYLVTLNDEAPIALLTLLTTVLAMVPFIGAAAVWLPVVGWIYLVDDRLGVAIGLAVYCGGVVSMIDNVIKPYVLHGQANLHPLLALLSVLGGVQVLGPVGILVGPMLVAFLQAILNMVHKELHLLGVPDSARKGGPPVDAVVQREAEAAAGTTGWQQLAAAASDSASDSNANDPGAAAASGESQSVPQPDSASSADAGSAAAQRPRKRKRKR